MKMNSLYVTMAATLICGQALAGTMRTVSVTGVGSVQTKPNVAHLSMTFTFRAPSRTVVMAYGNARVQVAKTAIQEIVGKGVKITAVPSVSEYIEYVVPERRVIKEKGHELMYTVSVKLRGSQADMEKKLAALFDANGSQINADNLGSPVMGLSSNKNAHMVNLAYKKAIENGKGQAAAQLWPGEKLGPALSRGSQSDGYSPRPQAAFMARDAGAGLESVPVPAVVKTGAITVSAVSHMTFQVLGQPKSKSAKPGKKSSRA